MNELMKELSKAMIEEQIRAYESIIEAMMDELDELVETLESFTEVPEENIEHDCYDCKYEALGIMDYPCSKCCNDSIEGDELYSCWKSPDEEDEECCKDCASCSNRCIEFEIMSQHIARGLGL